MKSEFNEPWKKFDTVQICRACNVIGTNLYQPYFVKTINSQHDKIGAFMCIIK